MSDPASATEASGSASRWVAVAEHPFPPEPPTLPACAVIALEAPAPGPLTVLSDKGGSLGNASVGGSLGTASVLSDNVSVSDGDFNVAEDAGVGPLGACSPDPEDDTRHPDSEGCAGLPLESRVDTSFIDQIVCQQVVASRNLTQIRLPWEQGPMKCIFSDDADFAVQSPSLEPLLPPEVSTPDRLVECLEHVTDLKSFFQTTISNVADCDINETLGSLLHIAINKLCVVVERCTGQPPDPEDIEARTGLRSPYTLIKRANSLLAYLRWVDGQPLANLSFSGVFQETLVWEHFQYLKKENKPPTSGSTLLSAMRFLHYVLEVDVQVCISSRRIVGASQQLAAKTRWLKQARALTVDQVRKLHELLEGSDDPLLRCFAAYALIAVYGRCRHSDLQCIWDLECDFDGVSGFLQIRTGRHKTSTTAKKKAQFLHILVPAQGVVSRPWLPLAIQAFEAVNLCLIGKIDGPIFRPPLDAECSALCARPVSSQEVSRMLRQALDLPEDSGVSSHSLKVTGLSWASKAGARAGMVRDTCAVLGRHARNQLTTEVVYSRDLSAAPSLAFSRLLHQVALGVFMPDAPLRAFWSESCEASPGLAPILPVVRPSGAIKVEDSASEAAESAHESSEDSSASEASRSSSSDSGTPSSSPPLSKKARRFLPETRDESDVWVIHRRSRKLHLVRGQRNLDACLQVLACGRVRSDAYRVAEDADLDAVECQGCRRCI